MDEAQLRAKLLAGARAFNNGQYFEAHEQLEDALEEVPEELWTLFVGLIQVAVGYHKVTQQLLRGAALMLERGLAKLRPLAEDAGGVRLEPLRQRVGSDIAALRAGAFDAAAFTRHPPRLQIARDQIARDP